MRSPLTLRLIDFRRARQRQAAMGSQSTSSRRNDIDCVEGLFGQLSGLLVPLGLHG